MIEPSGSYRDINLCRNPVISIRMSCSQYWRKISPGIHFIPFKKRPVCRTSQPAFIANPSYIGSGIAEHYCIWLELPDYFVSIFPVVISLIIYLSDLPRSPVIAITPIGSIKPDLKNVSIFCKEFTELVAIVGNIFRTGIYSAVAIPWGKIYTKLKPVFLTGLWQISYHIPFAIFPFRLFYWMGCILWRPEAKAIVMLCCNYDAFHSCLFCNSCPLPAIKRCRIENCFCFIPKSPLPVGECIYSKMSEHIIFHLMPCKLSFRGQRANRVRRFYFITGD